MRFPRDMAETERMILTAIDGGVNYFDTAYMYPGSEETLGKILDKHKKRESVFIATKLPLIICKGPGDFDRFFNKELERLRTDHIDYYLMHMITDFAQWEIFRGWGIEQWIAEKKRAGKIRQIGFSFHGSCGEFLKILDSCAWEFCQIQYNYSNENYQAGRTGLQAAAAKGIPVMIMEPLLGGKLAAGLPAAVARLFARADPSLSPAAWAFLWLWNQSEVSCVLSGTNTAAQMEENIRAACAAHPLSEAECAVYTEAITVFNRSWKIHCTGCNYCMPCPRGINIPGCFAAYNTSFAQGFVTGMQQFITGTAAVGRNPHSPRLCVQCGACEKHCPQHLPIRRALKKVAARMEPLPIRVGLSLARNFFR
ncbi:MAG: aldo/keto reductase [Treponema sp.]|nr:aldo/keto reductase [Treponema sp.]